MVWKSSAKTLPPVRAWLTGGLPADSLDTVAAYVGMLRSDVTVESPPELVPLLEVIADRYRRAAAGS